MDIFICTLNYDFTNLYLTEYGTDFLNLIILLRDNMGTKQAVRFNIAFSMLSMKFLSFWGGVGFVALRLYFFSSFSLPFSFPIAPRVFLMTVKSFKHMKIMKS